MNNNLKLSLIVPVYNVEQYLNQCIESIVSVYRDGIEVILVNDGSKDKSGEICNFYANKYEFIKVIHKKNGGLSSARNTGINISKGKYIWFIDSDDYISNSSINDIFYRINKNVDVIVGNYALVSNNKIELICQDFIKIENNELLFQYFNRLGNISYAAVRFIIKRELIINNNLKFVEGIYHEDEEWTPRVICSAESFCVIKDVIYYYRVGNPNSITGKLNPKKILDKLIVANKLYGIISKNNYSKEMNNFIKTRIAHNYIAALNESFQYDNEEKKELINELKRNKNLLNNILIKKALLVRISIKVIGVTNTAKLLNFRKSIWKNN